MNLFTQSQSEEKVLLAKKALIAVVKMNVKNYLTAQGSMIELLADGKPFGPDKKARGKKGKKHVKNCKFCKINSLMAAMSKYKDIAAEAVFNHNNLFDEELDLDTVFEQMDAEMNSSASGDFVLDKDGKLIMPADAPEDVKAMMTTIQEALIRNGMAGDMSMEVINLKADNFGLKPEDFKDFGEYARAVSQKRQEFVKNNQGKSGEDIINEAVIHKAEMTVDNASEQTKEKLN